MLAAQMTQNNIIDKYNLSLEKNNITLDLSDDDIDNIITYYRGNPDQLNDILLSRNDNFPLDSTSEKDAQAYVLINYLCDTNQNYYNCFKAISEERINSNASLSNIIPDNVRTFFKERSDFINEQLDKKAYDKLYTNGDIGAFETFVNEIPSKYDETLQELVDTYYTGGTKETGKPIEMVLRARVISTLDGCSKEDAQTILDNKKQNLQTYDTLVLEQPIDFSAFTKLAEEAETTDTQAPSLRETIQQHQEKNRPKNSHTKNNYDLPETNHDLPETNHDLPLGNHDLPETNHDYPETNHDYPVYPDDQFQPDIFLGDPYLDNYLPPEFEIDESQFEYYPEQNFLTHWQTS